MKEIKKIKKGITFNIHALRAGMRSATPKLIKVSSLYMETETIVEDIRPLVDDTLQYERGVYIIKGLDY